MACLNKLAIRGIRSFDDKQISVIEFFTPVTVIVGHNGSGKTTIIECLKYATTGDQPPNSRGGAFVHDPKMANEKEVKAQVKLRFHAANGTRMLAVRNLSVTMKKTSGLTMKTLESILSLADGGGEKGKRGTISTKCAEMDVEIPQLLGVSKSVLENVIFCHQEDSYWPLAEAATLKKKFDDIFEATRYTKALDSIKSLRKERVQELKAEKERLDHLATQKAHADKLKRRIADSNRSVASKEVEHEALKKSHTELQASNIKFYEYATRFREKYLNVENLEKKKKQFQEQLNDIRTHLTELPGTDEELNDALENHETTVSDLKEKRRKAKLKLEDIEVDQKKLQHMILDTISTQAGLQSEVKAQENRLADREALIRDIAHKRGLKGYDSSPLSKERLLDLVSRITDLQRKQKLLSEDLQAEISSKTEEYNNAMRASDAKLSDLRSEKKTIRNRNASNQSAMAAITSKIDSVQGLPHQISTLVADIEEKKSRLQKAKAEFLASKFDEQLRDIQVKARTMEESREELNKEITSLSKQADSRARLEDKRNQLKSKKKELDKLLSSANMKYRKLIGSDAQAETMEREVKSASSEKEKELTELQSDASAAEKALQHEELTLSNLQTELHEKSARLKAIEKRLRGETDSLERSIIEADGEVKYYEKGIAEKEGSSKIYEGLLKLGKEKRVCGACNRGLDDHELIDFEKHLKKEIKDRSPEALAAEQHSREEWAEELKRLQGLIPFEVEKNALRHNEIPQLEKKIEKQNEVIPTSKEKAEELSYKVDSVKRELRDIALLRDYSLNATRLNGDLMTLTDQIRQLESELAATGSTKTVEDVQAELDEIAIQIRANERGREGIAQDKERHTLTVRKLEDDVKDMEYTYKDLSSQLRDKAAMEDQFETLQKEISQMTSRAKDIDREIEDVQSPMKQLENEFRAAQSEISGKVKEAQTLYQELNMNLDKLESSNKSIERFVRDRIQHALEECIERKEELDGEMAEISKKMSAARDAIAAVEKEASTSDLKASHLRQNIHARKLAKEIAATQAEIDTFDMEEAAKARRTFQERYQVEKDRENELQAQWAHLGGEISSLKQQLKEWEGDLKEYKDIYKKYTDQLITVKMSDMANNDLEKYAKALDNAIMKYHGLKMEEVNDTMKHLWNKTYQGTDIDGIKIRSDVEGGASKRSYNYRVVMTKDQVEMDMRGRCSAGQKMLASIIIRLALSDSFGQNCGILALDEPTNALDTENIDALAASLVDIINERKDHSSFQLIIITHDENFLRKLGQSEVMEYYWRVSRDSRQKSVIERQRFA